MTSTKNLGERKKIPVRLGASTQQAAEMIAALIPMPVNGVYSLGVHLMSAQFAPLLASKGLSLDALEEDMRCLFADARRVIATKPNAPKKQPKGQA